jgi:hypothetical protein
MMDHPNMSENAHLVGQLRQAHNTPVDTESEDAQEENGDGVRIET